MKLRVVGWTYYDDDLPQGENCWSARYAVIDEIKKHGYLFSGWSHQECQRCAPVMNDGKLYCFSQRGWGSVMAEAHGYTGRMDYALFTFVGSLESEIRPTNAYAEDEFVPEIDLNERFELEVEQHVFESAQQSHEIKLDDLPQLRYLDIGDTLALTCNQKTIEYTVEDVDRARDLTPKELRKLEFELLDEETFDRAEEEFNKAKIIMTIKLA